MEGTNNNEPPQGWAGQALKNLQGNNPPATPTRPVHPEAPVVTEFVRQRRSFWDVVMGRDPNKPKK